MVEMCVHSGESIGDCDKGFVCYCPFVGEKYEPSDIEDLGKVDVVIACEHHRIKEREVNGLL